MSSKTDSKTESKTDSFVKLAIFLFVTLLSFSVGIFAGKKFSDNQHALSALEPQKAGTASREVASTHDEGHDAKPSAMTDEEIAKLAEEFVADETTPVGEHGGAEAKGHDTASAANHGSTAPTTGHAPAATVQGDTAKVTGHEVSKAAQDLAAGKTPTGAVTTAQAAKPAVENRVPNALPKEVGDFNVGKFTVQVAAYADEAEAVKMSSDLKTKGYSAYYIPAKVNGKTWYRVSVGQFATQKEASNYRSQFIQKSKVETAIVQKITQ